jgi:hypothetical protein
VSRKLLWLALGAAAAAVVISVRHRSFQLDASGNGGAGGDDPLLRRAVGAARERLRADAPGP